MSATSSSTTTGISFIVGLLLGSALIAPVLPETFAALPSLAALGPVGKALIAGALAIVLLGFGIMVLYLGSLVVDTRSR